MRIHDINNVPEPGLPFVLTPGDRVCFHYNPTFFRYTVQAEHLAHNFGDNAAFLRHINRTCGVHPPQVARETYGLRGTGAWPEGPLTEQARFVQWLFHVLRKHYMNTLLRRLTIVVHKRTMRRQMRHLGIIQGLGITRIFP